MIELLAPAKINLSLHVKGRRDDGFHELETLMCPITVFDRLEIETLEEEALQFTCDDPTIPTGEENLVVRAARLFCGEVGLQPNLRIRLRKGIPHGAGLGGGSSDAATMLLGLNHVFQTNLPSDTLAAMAAELGSDVPFFTYQSAAVCRGRGEQVEPVAFPHELPLLLIKPPFGVPTPWAYSRWKDSLEVPGVPYEAQQFAWGTLFNDLERPVFEKYLFLATMKSWLLEQPEVAGALMSGSGSTMLTVLETAEVAEAVGARVAEQFGTDLWCRLCQTITNRCEIVHSQPRVGKANVPR